MIPDCAHTAPPSTYAYPPCSNILNLTITAMHLLTTGCSRLAVSASTAIHHSYYDSPATSARKQSLATHSVTFTAHAHAHIHALFA